MPETRASQGMTSEWDDYACLQSITAFGAFAASTTGGAVLKSAWRGASWADEQTTVGLTFTFPAFAGVTRTAVV